MLEGKCEVTIISPSDEHVKVSLEVGEITVIPQGWFHYIANTGDVSGAHAGDLQQRPADRHRPRAAAAAFRIRCSALTFERRRGTQFAEHPPRHRLHRAAGPAQAEVPEAQFFGSGRGEDRQLEVGRGLAAAADVWVAFWKSPGLALGMSVKVCGLRSTSGNQLLWTWTMTAWPRRKTWQMSGMANWILASLPGSSGFGLFEAVAEFGAERLAAHQLLVAAHLQLVGVGLGVRVVVGVDVDQLDHEVGVGAGRAHPQGGGDRTADREVVVELFGLVDQDVGPLRRRTSGRLVMYSRGTPCCDAVPEGNRFRRVAFVAVAGLLRARRGERKVGLRRPDRAGASAAFWAATRRICASGWCRFRKSTPWGNRRLFFGRPFLSSPSRWRRKNSNSISLR